MNTETKAEESPELTQRAETERVEREQKRIEQEGEMAIVNAVVDKINVLVDRMNDVTSERINVRHAYSEASVRLEMDRTKENADEMRTVNNRLHELDREHFNVSRELAVLEVEYVRLSKAYDEKWTTAWSAMLNVNSFMQGAISKFIGSYLYAITAKKTP